MSKVDIKKFSEELKEFESQPENVSDSDTSCSELMDRVRKDLLILKISTILKLIMIHAIITPIVILVCPQFDITFISGYGGLATLFNYFGHHGCFFLCGAFYLAITTAIALRVLPNLSKRYLYSALSLQGVIVLSLTLACFSIFKTIEINSLTAVWLIGAFTSIFVVTKVAENKILNIRR